MVLYFSTFAWYTASASMSVLGKTDNITAAISSNTGVDLSGFKIDVVLDRNDSIPNLALTSWAGGSFKSVALVNGVEQPETNTNYEGSYKLTLTWNGVEPSQAQKGALSGQTATFAIKSTGNVVLLKDEGTRSSADKEATNNVTVTVTWTYNGEESVAGADGITYGSFSLSAVDGAGTPAAVALTVKESGSNVFTGGFAITPNNLNGPEALAQTNGLATQQYKVGDVVKYSDDLYICKAQYTEANASADVSADTTHWEKAVMHSEDGIDFVS